MPKPNEAYGDTIDENEEEELRKLMESDDVPEPDEKDGASTDDDGDPSDDDGDEPNDDDGDPVPPKKDQEPKDEGDDDDGDDAGDDDQWRDFLDKHKGKSPEELARLAFQQNKRANRASYDGRQAQERLNSVLGRIEEAKKARVTALEQQRAEFDRKLETDPDAATREAYEQSLRREQAEAEAEADREAFEARAGAAVEFASAYIPDFAQRAPAIRDFGLEMGFTQDEVHGLVDGRQIVTLHLAAIAGNMMKAGLIDPSGKFLKLPEPVKPRESGDEQGEKPQRRTQFSRQPARGPGTQKSLEERLADISNMSDADFAKLSDTELDALLEQAETE